MTPAEFEHYLHQTIPLSQAMQVSILEIKPEGVLVSAPLAPNINHCGTIFGGSASAVATISAWAFVYTRLASEGIANTLVIQHHSMDYELPITGEFTAQSFLEHPEDWDKFTHTLDRRGRARITVRSVLKCKDQVVGHLEGKFVAIKDESV